MQVTPYESKHIGSIFVFVQYIPTRREWTAYATNKGQYFWTTQGSFTNAFEAENETVRQIEQQYETHLERKVPV